jgi:hypothetical protein
MPDDKPCLSIVTSGVRRGVTAGGKVHWLPPELWAPAAELERRMEAMNKAAERMAALWREAEQAAWDEVPGVLPRA